MKEGEYLLTPRQQEILYLIVSLYGKLEEPVGSKTLLRESLMPISPATVRNEMVVLEKNGYLIKAHTSSGRIPSVEGYRYYVEHIIDQDYHEDMIDDASFAQLINNKHYNPLQLAQLTADILVSLTGYTAVVLGQDQEAHHLAEFKLVMLNERRYLSIIITNFGKIESHVGEFKYEVSKDDLSKITTLINEELSGSLLEDAYQRLKLSIPLLTQRITGYQIDFSQVVEKAMLNIRGHQYYVSGKSNLLEFIELQDSKENIKEIFEIIDGSNTMYQLLEKRQAGINVIFGEDLPIPGLNKINLITGSYINQNQKITIGLFGPTVMSYEKILPMFDMMLKILRVQ